MTVTELLSKILAVYPGADAEAMKAIKGAYHSRLQRHEGDKLETAANEVFATFKPKFGQPFPIPADFEAHLPGKLDLGKDKGTPPLDLEGRKRRADSLFANWQADQCRRADKGNPLLRRALENVARQVADVMGWHPNPRPLVLTHDQLKAACQAAISQERRARHGQPPKDKYLWWKQIASIASEWGINQCSPEWWDKTTGEAFKAGADDEPAPVSRITSTTVLREGPPIPRNREAQIELLKANIKFLRDMGIVDGIPAKERELTALEMQAEAA